MRSFVRKVSNCGAMATIVLTLAIGSTAAMASPKPFNIDSEDAPRSLLEFGRQSAVQILFASEKVKGIVTNAVRGSYEPIDALHLLLKGTPLVVREKSDGVLVVELQVKEGVSSERESVPANDGGTSARLAQSDTSDARLQVKSGSVRGADDASSVSSGPERSGLGEIIVTAEKRSERLQDVPVPVTVLSGADLVENNQTRLQDYYASVPGLSVVGGSSSSTFQTVSIRGITTGTGTNPTVGITIDDVPYGSATSLGYGNVVPDLDPDDLARIEVLRGPQGTLYGASSMGGLIKFVTLDPSTSDFSGRAQAGLDGVHNGAEAGYNFRASVNVPLSDTLAIRASAFTRKDPGYIDNPVLHTDGVNDQQVSGGRLAGLWRPSEALSLKVSALYQSFSADGVNDVTPGLGDLQQNYIRGVGASSGNIQAYSATLTAKLGNVDLTALSGYNTRHGHIVIDETAAFGGLVQPLYGVGGAGLIDDNNTDRFTQEIRLSGPIGDRIDWLLGGIYTHEDSSITQEIPAINPASGAVVAIGYQSTFPSTYREYAAFADLTFHITDQFDVQAGVRGGHIKQTFQQTTVDPLFTGGSTALSVGSTENASASPVTYLLTPRFKVSNDLMVYARFASGYRVGGPNAALCTTYHFPCQFGPDKTKDYEVGAKSDFLDHRLSFDASLYYIDWKNIQLNAIDPVSHQTFNSNTSHAKSQGVELAVKAKPRTGLTIAVQAAYDDAVLTQGFPATVTLFGPSGSRLPYTSRFSGSVSIDQRFPIGAVTGSVGASASYVGDRLGNFSGSASAPRQNLPEYVRTDLRAGVEYHTWSYNFFANNVFDRRGLLDGPLDTFAPALIYIQPRTIGLNVAKTF
jgi:iron complex outermembrane recepter protein